MPTLTRGIAIGYARGVFHDLVEQALSVAGDDAEYIRTLAVTWDDQLARLDAVGAQLPLSDDKWQVLRSLAATVVDPALTRDAILEWVDAYPDAIVDLLPLEWDFSWASEYADVEVEEEPAGGMTERQPALALAA